MMQENFDLVVVGGGAAGFFGAIQCAERNPAMKVVIVEKSNKVLSKVRVSGGGRCNVTHNCFNPFRLADHYPRGERQLKELFKFFQAEDMVNWLNGKGVLTKAEDDGRMFPISDDSSTIIECFMREAFRHNIKIELGVEVVAIVQDDPMLKVITNGKMYGAKNVLMTIGGNPKPEFYNCIRSLGHAIIPPIPSLFTFNDSKKDFVSLMGVSCPSAEVRIRGTKYAQRGPVLITHWGLSGPAVIKLSAWAATLLHEKKYDFTVSVNWIGVESESDVRTIIDDKKKANPKQKVLSSSPVNVPNRLWEKLCLISEIDEMRVWGELSNRQSNKLLENLYRCEFQIKGKTTFKEEFVTCGGVDLKEINMSTMESQRIKNLFFAGEVLNIDGETGGFNFQAAWTTAYVAAQEIGKRCANPV